MCRAVEPFYTNLSGRNVWIMPERSGGLYHHERSANHDLLQSIYGFYLRTLSSQSVKNLFSSSTLGRQTRLDVFTSRDAWFVSGTFTKSKNIWDSVLLLAIIFQIELLSKQRSLLCGVSKSELWLPNNSLLINQNIFYKTISNSLLGTVHSKNDKSLVFHVNVVLL